MNQLDAVAAALKKAFLEEYDSTWNDDVTRRFAQAAIGVQGSSQQLRIEALRAAATISGNVLGRTGAANVALGRSVDEMTGKVVAVATLRMAEQFAAWLETGER